ncbi:FecR family protein [Roseicyclus amphidinii]|uniref:FecR family protein n=1 Tax=Roseicyclus amphidinii TaxID=3034232 RepID=UPI0024E0F62B|nr:FecR domain-containing protein [Roseicyclus sp. Amp-Y-6]
MRQIFLYAISTCLIGLFWPGPAAAAPIATAVEVDGSAQVSFGGNRSRLSTGARIEEGSVIETADTGLVQLTFDDGTNMVVGPRSRLEITSVLIGGGNRASRFAVNAVAGGFRFLSGGSDPDVYDITTPTATLGIRGTAFDIAVAGRDTALALFTGEVEMCARNQRCFIVRGPCAVARTAGQNRIRGVTGRDAAELIAGAFPLIGRQRPLRPEFRVEDGSCNRYRVLEDEASVTPQRAPERNDPDPEPPSSSAGRSGASASAVSPETGGSTSATTGTGGAGASAVMP